MRVSAGDRGGDRHTLVGQWLALGPNALLAGAQSSEVLSSLGDDYSQVMLVSRQGSFTRRLSMSYHR